MEPASLDPSTSLGVSATGMRWAALGDAGSVVAMLAGIEPEQPSEKIRNFPALISTIPAWHRQLAENGVADLAAIMEPGISALLAVNASGGNPQPAAEALWQEFTAARTAILSLAPPSG